VVTRVEHYAGQCPCCGGITLAPLPEGLEPGTPFSLNIVALAMYLRFVHAVSYRRLSRLLLELFRLAVSEGALDAAFRRGKPQFDADVANILARLRRARIICSDETSVRIDGRTCWNWVFQNDAVVIHVVRKSRGACVVAEVLGGHRPAIWVSDLYSAQQGHAADWQLCLAHQLRDCQFAIEAGDAVFAPRMKALLKRPLFLPIISASSLATTLARKATGRVDGFVVEGPTAGGHNAPPRGEPRFNDDGEPLYGERDVVDLAKIRELGLPFWLAGGTGSAEGMRAALAAGAAGIQVGTMFAYCDESGLTDEIRARVLAAVSAGTVRVRTDPRASSTGYPFKVVEVEGMPSQNDTRVRVCDIGYLRVPYRDATGKLGYRCAAEPVDTFVKKGGDMADTIGRRCLCNGLLSNIGLPQEREEGAELPLVTSGDDLTTLGAFIAGRSGYSAADVVAHLLVGAGAAAG